MCAAIKVYKLGKCYACNEAATGLRDRRSEGGEIEPACGRHAEPSLTAQVVCMYCSEPVRGGIKVDGMVAHRDCHREACQ